MNTTERLAQTIRKHDLLAGGETVVLGVSGGPDSVFLFHAFCALAGRLRLRLVTAHFNHRLRRESDADERFVRTLAESRGVPFRSAREEIARDRAGTGRSLEEYARERRHAFFRRVAGESGASLIALGHTRDDRIETFLMRVFAGTGLSGLNAVRPRSGDVIHPLVELRKAEILAWLRDRGLPFRTDRSNSDVSIPRNFVRRRILPLVRARYENCDGNIANLADIVADEDAFMDLEAGRFLGDRCGPYDIAKFAQLPVALQRRVLRSLVPEPDFGLVERLRARLNGSRKANEILLEQGGRALLKKSGSLVVAETRETVRTAPFEHALHRDRELRIPELGAAIRPSTRPRGTRALKDRASLILDLDLLTFPLVVRNRREGDRMRLMGAKGTKKLQDIFIDLKIPRWERDRPPVVVSDGRIAGVFVNFAKPDRYNYISPEFAVGPATRRLLILTLVQ